MFRKNGPSKYIFAFVIFLLQEFCTCELVIKEEIPEMAMEPPGIFSGPEKKLLNDSSEKLDLENKTLEESSENSDLEKLKHSSKSLDSKMSNLTDSSEKTYSINKLSIKRPISRLWTEGEIKKFKLWPRGVIPYYIDDFSFDKVFRDRVRSFLEQTTEKTGLQFVEMPSPPDSHDVSRWVLFINRRGLLECPDLKIGNLTNEGPQRVVLGYDCLGAGGGEMAATVLALAGVPPQHNAPDRDKYIQVLLDNVIPEKQELLKLLPNEQWPFKDNFKYDFSSAGHYDFFKHTKNGKQTIKPVRDSSLPVGDVTGLSETDISKLRFLYDAMSQKPKSDISEDCSKMFKPGNANQDKIESDSSAKRKKSVKYIIL